ncbi:MAG: AEC family transporter [Lachnospiraceae bacterium]|nr:AEC family transporter [Lachnospiraceae bacterium]
MESLVKVLEIIMPIFVTILLGVLAKKKNVFTEEANKGLQKFVMTFCLPCVLFNSCLTGNFGMESIAAMVLVIPLMLLSSLWAFRARKKKYPYHNLPQLFSSQETGMLGIPLFITLFGTAHAFRMGVLDVAQGIVAIPIIAILSADTGKNPSVGYVVKKVFQSPLLLMSILGLVLNMTGAIQILNDIGIGGIITEVTGFISQPVSAVILFCVGYNFSLGKENYKHVLEICAWHLLFLVVFCAIIQAVLCIDPMVDAETRWAILLYCALPGSYLAAGLARTKEESTVAANVSSILTVICLLIFCVIAMIVA